MSYSLAFSQAIAIVLYVGDKISQGAYEFVPTSQLSKTLKIAQPSAVKILTRLSNANIIETREGIKGGIRLTIKPEKITLLDIFAAIETKQQLFNTDLSFRIKGVKPTRAHEAIVNILKHTENSMKAQLAKTSIADLISTINSNM